MVELVRGPNMLAAKNWVVGVFYRIGVKAFQFLADDLGFAKPVRKIDAGLYSLICQNRVTAVEIGLEWREQYIYVELPASWVERFERIP
jgi:hypothetical protein